MVRNSLHRPLTGALLALAALLMAVFPPVSRAAAPAARRWKIMVVIPERHLERPHIPDPACETAVRRALIDAEYKVVDPERYAALRDSALMDRINAGGATARKDAQALGRKFGADLLIVGEAFSQEVSRRTVETDVGVVTSITCRARVELKGYRTDTAEIVYSDSIQKSGSPDLTVELSSKICLEQAGDDISEGIIKKLGDLSRSTTRSVEYEIRNLSSATQSQAIQAIMAKLPGVQEVNEEGYDAHTLTGEMVVSLSAAKTLASALESHPSMARFHLKTLASSNSKIIATVK